jgi:hypothetical protein
LEFITLLFSVIEFTYFFPISKIRSRGDHSKASLDVPTAVLHLKSDQQIPFKSISIWKRFSMLSKTQQIVLVVIFVATGLFTLIWMTRTPYSYYFPRGDGYRWHSALETRPELWKSGIQTAFLLNKYNISRGPGNFIAPLYVLPQQRSWQSAVGKVVAFCGRKGLRGKDQGLTYNLVVYNVEDVGSNDNSITVTSNNFKAFVASVLLHDMQDQENSGDVFYWFNVASMAVNPLKRLIPAYMSNVAVVDWRHSSTSLNTFLQTMTLLDPAIPKEFGAIFHLNSGVRGPLVKSEYGEWVTEFRSLLDTPGVGIVGPVLSCEGRPHVLPHAFAIRGMAVAHLNRELKRYYATTVFEPIDEYFRLRLTDAVKELGLQPASLQFGLKGCGTGTGTGTFWGAVGGGGGGAGLAAELTCAVSPLKLVFANWNGESLGSSGFVCGKGVAINPHNRKLVAERTMHLWLLSRRLAAAPGGHYGSDKHRRLLELLRPEFPEQLAGGVLSDLYHEYEVEFSLLDRSFNASVGAAVVGIHSKTGASASAAASASAGGGGGVVSVFNTKGHLFSLPRAQFSTLSAPAIGLATSSATATAGGATAGPTTDTTLHTHPDNSQVCFLVRTARMHDPSYVAPGSGAANAHGTGSGSGSGTRGSSASATAKTKYVNMDLDTFSRCTCFCFCYVFFAVVHKCWFECAFAYFD